MQFDGDNRIAEPCNNPERGVFIDSPLPRRSRGIYRLKEVVRTTPKHSLLRFDFSALANCIVFFDDRYAFLC